MKLIFIDDGPIYVDQYSNYYEYAFHGLYERYRYLAEDIAFATRVQKRSDKTDGTLVPKEVRIVKIPNYKIPRYYFFQKRKAKNILKNEIKDTDIVILRGSSFAHLALKYVRKYNKPYIYECVACDWDKYWNYSLIGKCIAPVMEFRARRAVRQSRYVYYVTQNYLQNRYPTKGKKVGCSNVVIENTDPKILENRLMRQKDRDINKETIIIGTAAAVDVKYKGQDDVIKALRILKDKNINVIYLLVGSNRSGSSYLLDLAKSLGLDNQVIYRGSLPAYEMKSFYDSLDIYIQPSKQEGLPRSLIEAMSRGVPCLASNIAGNPELLGKRFLFKKGSPEKIAERINGLAQTNLQQLERISKSNFIKSNREYNMRVLNERREAFYRDFLRDLGITKEADDE